MTKTNDQQKIHQDLGATYVAYVSETRDSLQEPGYVHTWKGTEYNASPLGEAPVKATLTALEDSEVTKVKPIVGGVDTAVSIQKSVIPHPATIATEVRIHYAGIQGNQQLPPFRRHHSKTDQYETAISQFTTAFTEPADGESIPIDEFTNVCSSWYSNLTGREISSAWIGRMLSMTDFEKRDGELVGHTWIDKMESE